MELKRSSSLFLLGLLLLAGILAVVPGPVIPYSAPGYNCSATSPFGTGADGNVTLSVNTAITTNKNYGSLTVNSGVVVTITSGVTIKVCGTFTNSGTIISDGSTGSTGSMGSAGSTGGAESAVSCSGGSSRGGNSGSNGGGGGAVSCIVAGSSATGGTGGTKGGNGGSGVSGTPGGIFTFYVWVANNAGTIHANGGAGGDGGSGGNGGAGTAGSISGTTSRSAGGGGGGNGGSGGSGGTGGNGGTITLYYGSTTGSGTGTVQAFGGSGGAGAGGGAAGSGGAGIGSFDGNYYCVNEAGGSGNGGGNGGSVNSGCIGSDGSAGTAGGSGSSGSMGASGTVTVQQIIVVTQPYIVATPAGSSALTGTISGCSTNSTSFTTSATKHFLAVIDSCVVTFTMPGPSSGTRGVFSSNSTTTTVTTCPTGTCTVFQPADYAQLQHPYGMKPSTGTFDATYSESVTGTASGNTGTVCGSISLTSATTYAFKKCWFDYNTLVSLVSQFSAGGSTKGTWTASANSASQTPLWTFKQTTANTKDNVTYAFFAQATPTQNFFGLKQVSIGSTANSVCSVTLANAAQGDLALLTLGAATTSSGTISAIIADSFNTQWKSVSVDSQGSGFPYTQVWTAFLTQSATDSITITLSPLVSTTSAGCSAYEFFGMQAFHVVAATAHSTGTSLATGSTAFSGSPYFAVAALASSASVTWTAGASFSLGGAGSVAYGSSEYSLTVTSPTTFLASQGTSTNWSEAGVVLVRGVTGADLYLQDSTTGLPFSIGGYQGSTAEVDYTAGSPTYYKLNMSATVVSLANAVKVEVWVGNSYFDAVVPSTEPNPANITMYLAVPAVVGSYDVVIQDLSGGFGAGSLLSVLRGGSVFFSGYTGAQNDLAVNMPPGGYSATIKKGGATYNANLTLPSTTVVGAAVQIQILYIKTSGTCVGCSTGWGVTLSGGTLSVAFNDTASKTTAIVDKVQVTNASGTFTVYTRSWTGKWGYFQDSVPCNNDNCNSSIAGELKVTLTVTSPYGTTALNAAVQSTGILGAVPQIPTNLLGFSVEFGTGANSPTPLSMLVFFIMLIAASIFGEVSAKFGVIPVAALAFVFAAAGWITLGPAGSGVFLIAISVMSFVGYLEQNR